MFRMREPRLNLFDLPSSEILRHGCMELLRYTHNTRRRTVRHMYCQSQQLLDDNTRAPQNSNCSTR